MNEYIMHGFTDELEKISQKTNKGMKLQKSLPDTTKSGPLMKHPYLGVDLSEDYGSKRRNAIREDPRIKDWTKSKIDERRRFYGKDWKRVKKFYKGKDPRDWQPWD